MVDKTKFSHRFYIRSILLMNNCICLSKTKVIQRNTNICALQELQAKTEQICEMAAVMAKAISIDDDAIQQEEERMVRLESENQGLRELLMISGLSWKDFEKFEEKKLKEEKEAKQEQSESNPDALATGGNS